MRSIYAPIKIVVADDHEIFRDGFADLLKKQTDIVLAGQAENGLELLEITEKLRPDVVLTDINMPVMDGISATKILSKKFPFIRVIALTMYNDDHYVLDMLDAGAKGYLLKNTHKTDILDAIKTVYNGEVYYCKETSMKLVYLMANQKMDNDDDPMPAEFNEKEVEIIQMICREFSNKEISGRVNLSVRTIEGYRKKIQSKMKVRNAAGIAVYAMRNKIFVV